MNDGTASLFKRPEDEPLAARLRPRTLEEFIGQQHILGEGRLLRRAIKADQLSSVIFYGPPGTGKTTLARVIANSTSARFLAINAVLGGVKDIREAVATATASQRMGQRTILFVDEVHRFNKAQQDALLPWVENGTVTLIGATTENPYFEVNKALVSRSRIFQLKPLTEDDLRDVVRQALADPERGYGRLDVTLKEDALDHLVNISNGDARALLNALELAVTTTPDLVITREVAEESIQQRAVLYDKEGDVHFDTISAFIKSMRGSDPDAALYWLARMVHAGEDPRFVFRRMIIFASEDVGLADPNALQQVMAAAQAYEWVGMPEGRYHLSQACLYLSTAPKSNSAFAFFDAIRAVEQEREAEVPNHLRDASRDSDGFGHGQGYLYPHAYRDHWVAQQYLPSALQGKVFYQPGTLGFEERVHLEVARRREAQLAGMLEADTLAPPEVLTTSPQDRVRDRWLQRTVSQAGERFGELRDRIIGLAGLQRHELVLDLKAGSGLLTWEAVRATPEGQVWGVAEDEAAASVLREQAASLQELDRPVFVTGLDTDQRFDVILGRNALATPDVTALPGLLHPGGRVVLAEVAPARAQRLYRLAPAAEEVLLERWKRAEEAVYEALDLPDEAAWREALSQVGFGDILIQEHVAHTQQRIGPPALARWFPKDQDADSYARRLLATNQLQDGDLDAIERHLANLAAAGPLRWEQRLLVMKAVLDNG